MADQTASSSRLRNYGAGAMGEIVEVQGGHIVRSTGRKDRHSKVCTAKGPRDRRVRLSAHTAIQFYDVQDRLGYDRPSKAVDWLIKKAKAAIDELDRLPAWNPLPAEDDRAPTTTTAAAPDTAASNFLPPSLDSDAIADTIKSFFPVVSGEQQTGSAGIQFHHHLQSQDLRLSLQSLQDPIFHHQNSEQAALFSGTTAAASFGWADQHHQSFVFNPPQPTEFGRDNSQLLFSSSSQRGPLQSSNTPSVRANWIDSQSLSMADQIPHPIQHHHHHHHHQAAAASSSSMPAGMGFGAGAFSSGGGFHHFPARIQGEEEQHGGAEKPSSASSDSRH